MSRYNIVSKLFGIKNTLPVSIHNPAIKGAVNNTTKQKGIESQLPEEKTVSISQRAKDFLANNTVTPNKSEVIPYIENAHRQLDQNLKNAGDKIRFANDYINAADMYKGKCLSYEEADIVFNFHVLNADELAYNRQMINSQISNILAKKDIRLSDEDNYSFSVDPYEYRIKVSGGSDEMNQKIEAALNGDTDSEELYDTNGFNLYTHIYNCTLYTQSEQTSKETQLKRHVQNFVLEKTGVDLRECTKAEDDYITSDGKSVKELLDNVIDTNSDGCSAGLSEEDKKNFKKVQRSYVDSVLQYDFNDGNDQVLSISYNSSTGLHDIGQTHGYGTGDTAWIDDLVQTQEAQYGMMSGRTFTYKSE